jgi:hypothetical protein
VSSVVGVESEMRTVVMMMGDDDDQIVSVGVWFCSMVVIP